MVFIYITWTRNVCIKKELEEQSAAAGASKIREQNLQIKRSTYGKDKLDINMGKSRQRCCQIDQINKIKKFSDNSTFILPFERAHGNQDIRRSAYDRSQIAVELSS